MCVGCAMAAASTATGARTWLQTRRFGWLTPGRLRALTIAAMSAAAIFSTVDFSGATPPSPATRASGAMAKPDQDAGSVAYYVRERLRTPPGAVPAGR